MLTVMRLAVRVCLASFALSADAAPPILRFGPERPGAGYTEKFPEAKAKLFVRINKDRAAHGLTPLQYDPLGAKVGDAFCLESAQRGFTGHYDPEGRAPYRRWTDAGGFDWHMQNVGAISRVGGRIEEPIEKLLFAIHDEMMAERPPRDGHRRAILDPEATHVGIGAAVFDGEFRMSQEFSRRVVAWIELPTGPLEAGKLARLAARVPPPLIVGSVDISFEPREKTKSFRELSRRKQYGLPQPFHTERPRAREGTVWADGRIGDFDLDPSGRFELVFPLSRGPGTYYAVVYVGTGPGVSTPATVAAFVAE